MQSVTITKKLFGGKIDFIVYDAPKEIITEIVEEIYQEGLRLQKIFNFYDPESELSRLNKQRNKKVSPELLYLIKKATAYAKLTQGNYDPSLGKFITLRKEGTDLKPTCSYKEIMVKENNVFLKHPDILIDLGSIGKGFITEKMANLMEKRGVKEFVIDARGDICVRGVTEHVFEIQDPRSDESICSIKVKNQAVATSGDYNQFVDDFTKSHIINQKDTISVTIVASSLEKADAYATMLFTCSQKDQEKILQERQIKAFLIKKDKSIKITDGFKELLY